MKRSNWISFIFAFVVFCNYACAQNLMGSAGGTATNSNLFLSWSVGEAAAGSATASTTAMTIGFQQPAPLIITSTFDDPQNRFSVFPNPAHDVIFVERSPSSIDVRVKLYDVNGKNLHEINFDGASTKLRIITETLTAGVYILRGFSGERIVFERKIVKL